MINVLKYIFFFTIVFVVGSAISQQNMAQWHNTGSSQSTSTTLCQKLTNGSISSSSEDASSFFDHGFKSSTDNASPKTLISCNSLLNILPAENNFSFNPGEQQLNIGFNNAVPSSQIFVFQEPDPPRLG